MNMQLGTEWRVVAHIDQPGGDRTSLLVSPDGRAAVFYSYAAPFSAIPQLVEYADEFSARLTFGVARDKAISRHGELPVDRDEIREGGE
jgi:hypothetical protein